MVDLFLAQIYSSEPTLLMESCFPFIMQQKTRIGPTVLLGNCMLCSMQNQTRKYKKVHKSSCTN